MEGYRQDPAPDPNTQQTVPPEADALLGPGTRFEGKLFFEGRVRIEGHLQGEVEGDDVLILGRRGTVHGTIRVGSLIIRGGEVQGPVFATQAVEIHAPGRVQGDIHTPELFIAKGATLAGKSIMPGANTHSLDDD